MAVSVCVTVAATETAAAAMSGEVGTPYIKWTFQEGKNKKCKIKDLTFPGISHT